MLSAGVIFNITVNLNESDTTEEESSLNIVIVGKSLDENQTEITIKQSIESHGLQQNILHNVLGGYTKLELGYREHSTTELIKQDASNGGLDYPEGISNCNIDIFCTESIGHDCLECKV